MFRTELMKRGAKFIIRNIPLSQESVRRREERLRKWCSTPFSIEQYAEQRPWSYTAIPPCLQAWQLEVRQGSRSLGQCLTKQTKQKAIEREGWRHMIPEAIYTHSAGSKKHHLKSKSFSSLKKPCNKVVSMTVLSRIFNFFVSTKLMHLLWS